MLIRSQDKKRIINFSNVDSICIINNFNGEEIENEICSFNGVNDSKTNLGKYSTEEKAIKVLDMIQKEYGRHYYGEGGPLTTMNHYVEPFAFIPPKVFQMPSDEEVEV